MTVQRFTPLQRALHWVMAVCIIAMLFIGVGMASTVAPQYLALVGVHKSLGIVVLLLAVVRLVVRLRSGTPPLPADLPEPMKLAAHLSHYVLYALMIAMPLLGWAELSAGGFRSCCGAAFGFRRSRRKATPCTRPCGTRIST
jgi:cytochrome b561